MLISCRNSIATLTTFCVLLFNMACKPAHFCSLIHIPTVTTNWLRHSWATYAWRIGVPIDTISLALGHSFGLSVTNGYIQKDLSAADAANRLVLDTIAGTTYRC